MKTQSDVDLDFLQQLDIGMIESALEPNRTYQNFDKYTFIQKLGAALDEFIQSGDTFLLRYPGFCNAKTCKYKYKGFTFIGNNSGNFFNLIVDIKDGVVQDIFECNKFKCFSKIDSKNRCIEIDKTEFPF
jgi:hypothetical protein